MRVIYIAKDGKEFNDIYQCREYEEKLKFKQRDELIADMLLPQYTDVIPIDVGGESRCEKNYRWYQVRTPEQWTRLRQAYPKIPINQLFPEIYCIEDNDAWGDGNYAVYRLTQLANDTKEFWKKFNYEVSFKYEEQQ